MSYPRIMPIVLKEAFWSKYSWEYWETDRRCILANYNGIGFVGTVKYKIHWEALPSELKIALQTFYSYGDGRSYAGMTVQEYLSKTLPHLLPVK